MSRAFVKENDLEHAGIDIPERLLSNEPNYVTPNGLRLLNETIGALEKERKILKQKKMTPLQNKKLQLLSVICVILQHVSSQRFSQQLKMKIVRLCYLVQK